MNGEQNYRPDASSLSSGSSRTGQSGEVTRRLAADKLLAQREQELISQLEALRSSNEEYFKEKIDPIVAACNSGDAGEIIAQHARLITITNDHNLRKTCRELIYAAAEALPENQGTLDLLLTRDFIREVDIPEGKVLLIVGNNKPSNEVQRSGEEYSPKFAYVDTKSPTVSILRAPGVTVNLGDEGSYTTSYKYYLVDETLAKKAKIPAFTENGSTRDKSPQQLKPNQELAAKISGDKSVQDALITRNWSSDLQSIYKEHRDRIKRLQSGRARIKGGQFGTFVVSGGSGDLS